MSNYNNIFRYGTACDDDLYKIVNCDQNSTAEQIYTEYKILALQYHPDKNSDKEAEAKFQKLQEAKETLCNPQKRCIYDKWRNSGISISFRHWLSMRDQVHQSMHWVQQNIQNRMLLESAADNECSVSKRLAYGGDLEARAATYFGSTKDERVFRNSDICGKFRNYQI